MPSSQVGAVLPARMWFSIRPQYVTGRYIIVGISKTTYFFGYAYRWVHTRETISADLPGLNPVQRRLIGLGGGDGDHAWGHYPNKVPLYGLLKEHDLLDPKHPPLKP